MSTAHVTSDTLFGALDAPHNELHSNVRPDRDVHPDPRLRDNTAPITSRSIGGDKHDSSPAVSLLAAAPTSPFIDHSHSAPISSTTSIEPRPRATGHRDEHDGHIGIDRDMLTDMINARNDSGVAAARALEYTALSLISTSTPSSSTAPLANPTIQWDGTKEALGFWWRETEMTTLLALSPSL